MYCGGMNVANRLRERIVTEDIRTAILDEAGGDPAAIDFRAFLAAVRINDAFALEAWDEYIERLAQGVGQRDHVYESGSDPDGHHRDPCGRIPAGPAPRAGEAIRVASQRGGLPHPAQRAGARIGDLSALAVAAAGLGPSVSP